MISPHLFRSDVLTWLPASVLFVGIIYAGSKALSRLVSIRIPVCGQGHTAPLSWSPWWFSLLHQHPLGLGMSLDVLTRSENRGVG